LEHIKFNSQKIDIQEFPEEKAKILQDALRDPSKLFIGKAVNEKRLLIEEENLESNKEYDIIPVNRNDGLGEHDVKFANEVKDTQAFNEEIFENNFVIHPADYFHPPYYFSMGWDRCEYVGSSDDKHSDA
jgi:hypothetical protein